MRNTVIKHREGNIGKHGEYTVNTGEIGNKVENREENTLWILGKHSEYSRKHREYWENTAWELVDITEQTA